MSIVLPKVETEAWILAGIESVRGIRDDAVAPDDPEQVRDAKDALSALMTGSRGYVATDDQPAFLAGSRRDATDADHKCTYRLPVGPSNRRSISAMPDRASRIRVRVGGLRAASAS